MSEFIIKMLKLMNNIYDDTFLRYIYKQIQIRDTSMQDTRIVLVRLMHRITYGSICLIKSSSILFMQKISAASLWN